MKFFALQFGIVQLVCCLVKLSFAETCQDYSLDCSHYSDLCGISPFLQEYCKLTCNTCNEDLCEILNGGCDQVCSTINNTVSCSCFPGFQLSEDETSCVDVCKISNGGCNQLCNNVDNAASCSCFPGFQLSEDNKTCVDINECTEGPNPCNNILPTYCINSVGSYSCQSYDCASSRPGTMNYYKSGECCRLNNNTCGSTASIRQKISRRPVVRTVGGEDASSSAWPWMVQILVEGRHICGGSLLTDRWVVTAASCLNDNPIRSMTVHLGHIRNAFIQFLDNSRSVVRGVAGSIIHSHPELNNIALIELSEPVTFDDRISPICLPCGEQPQEGDKCWAAGFGADLDSAFSFPSRILQEVDLPIVSMDRCSQAYANQFDQTAFNSINRKTSMCAGYNKGGKDTCYGDGGGPLMCQRKDSCEWYLSGITSFGIGCGKPAFYGIYTRVAKFEAWIRSSLGEAASDLCTQNYSSCNGLEDSRTDCDSIPNLCDSVQRHECSFTCCQRRDGLATSCFDTPGAENVCFFLGNHCDNPDLKFFTKKNCKYTCSFC